MLEQSTLLLRPWTPPSPCAGPARRATRPILDAVTGTALGFACWQPAPSGAWALWLTPPTLAIHEAEDEPLLCTVHRSWGWRRAWEVRDADARRVSLVSRQAIQDRWGRELAVCLPGPRATIWQDPSGLVLATLDRTGDGWRLTFAATVASEPFAKMSLLAAALVCS